MATVAHGQEPLAEAFDAGRRAGLAVAAVALGAVAFLSLLGLEKAGLAIILGLLALRGRKGGVTTRRLAMAAIGLGTVFMLTAAMVLAVYWDRLMRFLVVLQKLS
jgi:hypothetical protein